MTDQPVTAQGLEARSTSGPTLRQGALVAIAGYLLSFGTPYASFHALPELIAPGDAARTSENIVAHPGLLSAAIFLMLLNFVGDILAAWGLYVLLRPASPAWSKCMWLTSTPRTSATLPPMDPRPATRDSHAASAGQPVSSSARPPPAANT